MPNWITNIVTINASDEVVTKIKEEVKTTENEFDFESILPIPKEFEENSRDWCLDNWGTKWNSSEVWEFEEGFTFNTAWCTPFNLLVGLSKKYPNVEFNVRFADEDFGHNVGEFTLLNGIETELNLPDGGSREAYEMAMDINYGGVDEYFDCNDDLFTEDYIEDGEELDDYILTMIDIAYDHKYYPFEGCDWYKLVLERFKEKAIADEKYEVVIIIQEELNKIKEEN
jgi:vacuolar-type H+-ATPase subunit F/Vma7